MQKSSSITFERVQLAAPSSKMKCTLLAAAFAALSALCDAAPTPVAYSLHEKRSSLPRLWVRGNRIDRDAILPFRIGLTQSNLENGYEHLMDV